MLFAGAWIFQAGAKKVRFLWRYRSIRFIYCRLIRGVAYLLILHASDLDTFGTFCVIVLFPLPELWHLFKFLKRQAIRRLSKWFLRSGREFNEDNRSRRLDTSRHFASCPREDNAVEIETNNPNSQYPFAAYDSSSFNNIHLQSDQDQLDRQGWMFEAQQDN
ncbi:hypothetical protein KR200_004713 [Drosophila serrata]|nr:hypothetical protein KR200_004713 [Drosophila serrata]